MYNSYHLFTQKKRYLQQYMFLLIFKLASLENIKQNKPNFIPQQKVYFKELTHPREVDGKVGRQVQILSYHCTQDWEHTLDSNLQSNVNKQTILSNKSVLVIGYKMTLHICQRGILQIIHCQFPHSVSIKIVQRNKETTCIKHCPVLLSTSSRAHTLTTPY